MVRGQWAGVSITTDLQVKSQSGEHRRAPRSWPHREQDRFSFWRKLQRPSLKPCKASREETSENKWRVRNPGFLPGKSHPDRYMLCCVGLGTWYLCFGRALPISYSTVVVSSRILVNPVFVFFLENVCKVSLAARAVVLVGSQRWFLQCLLQAWASKGWASSSLGPTSTGALSKNRCVGWGSSFLAEPEPQAGGQFSSGLLSLPLNMTKRLGPNNVLQCFEKEVIVWGLLGRLFHQPVNKCLLNALWAGSCLWLEHKLPGARLYI